MEVYKSLFKSGSFVVIVCLHININLHYQQLSIQECFNTIFTNSISHRMISTLQCFVTTQHMDSIVLGLVVFVLKFESNGNKVIVINVVLQLIP